MATAATRGHRPHVPKGRRQERKVYFDTEERAVIEVAAGMMGLRFGAYVASAAVRDARSLVARSARAASEAEAERAAPVGLSVSEAQELLDEVRQLRRLLGNVAGNLNDVARHANSTGELAPESAAVLDYVRRTNNKLDTELMTLLRRLR
ncbi:hypothetical protein ACN94_17980 [Gordonia paraffinivorans]|uniref:hypothetical protein n=1 Tax=Gordonia paraffinivorans TaxID=175628 RepID=UPI000D6211C4|nr:hypothetical protein [Gordonia paraffinivorans]MBY4575455.1 hypothetical protein [Gordonia paraffinivorans]PWD41351.1 hypothetical protein ACN93_19570 [Gordonia paraffinivorans]